MQRRLFLLFLLLSLLPTTVILLVNWQMSRRQLGFLDSPGLRNTLESSLDLARRSLEDEKSVTLSLAENLAESISRSGGSELPEPPPDAVYRFFPADGNPPRDAGSLGDGVESPCLAFAAGSSPTPGLPERLDGEAGSCLLLALPVPGLADGARLILVRRLDPELAADLDAVAAGGSRYRQLRVYYGDLVRSDTVLTMLLLGVALMSLSLWLSRLLARQVGAPLRELLRGTERIASGDLDYRVAVRAKDEVAELVLAFNQMTERLQRGRDELRRAERVAAWQGIARRLAHEIKNPLTPINLAMHRIANRSDDDTVRECVGAVLDETANLQRLADEFSLFARLPAPVPAELDLVELLQAVAELYLARGRIEQSWRDVPGSLLMTGDQGQLRQVFANLVKNAAEAMGDRGRLTFRFSGPRDGVVTVDLYDTGPGFTGPADELFEPYVSNKEGGTGLGLAIARKIVQDHGGSLTAENQPEGGALFRVELPLAGPLPPSGGDPPREEKQ